MSLKRKVKHNKTFKKYKIDNKYYNLLPIYKETNKTMLFKQQILEFLALTIKIKQEKGEYVKGKYLEKSQAFLALKSFDTLDDIEKMKEITPMTIRKCKEFVEKGTTLEIEDYKTNPLFKFLNVHGIGIKKAEVLVNEGIKTIDELRERQDLLNDVQRKGLQYYEDINRKIPRAEIDEYNKIFKSIFDVTNTSSFKIVGSYRRGLTESGDIDIIFSDKKNNDVMQKFIGELIKRKIIVEILSKGEIKCFCIAKISKGACARRLDFMFSPSREYSFATLYFTGSRVFNTLMRNKALTLGFSLNEHGLYKMNDGKKTHKVTTTFPTEKSIFEFLKIEYRKPEDRIGFNSFVNMKSKTLKVKKSVKSLKYLNGFKKKGITILEILSHKDLKSMVKLADNYYYKHNKPILTDEQYDILKSFCDNKDIDSGHTNISISKDKVDLPYFMGSMEKIKPDTNALANYVKNYKGPYVLSSKLDGISALYSTENKTKKLYTRGNGTKGLDISYLIPYLQLPDVANSTIRGELLIKKKLFNDKYGTLYKNVRNMIGGVMTTKQIEEDKWRDIDFVGYEVINPVLKPSDQIKWLNDNHVITVYNKTVKSITNNDLSKLLIDVRENDPYNVDGIVVVDDKIYERTDRKCPKQSFAFKMILTDQIMESIVVDVIWQISKNGYIKPKVRINPIDIGGTTITYASAHNASFIEKNKIGIGAVVQMVRSGDVIPKIQAVIKPAIPLMPDFEYVWNDSHVDIILQDVNTNKIVKTKKIISFMTTIDVPSFSEGNVKKVFTAGFDSIPKILKMKVEDFMSIPGFKSKLSNKICKGMKEKLDNTSLGDLMVATNIFGRGFGRTRAKSVLEVFPDIVSSNKSITEKIKMVSSIEGFGNKTALTFVPFIPTFLEFINETGLQHKLDITTPVINTEHALYKKKIVLTGFRDKLLEKEIIGLGGEISNSISKNTFILLVNSLSSDSGKADKARKLGVKMMTPYMFNSQYLH